MPVATGQALVSATAAAIGVLALTPLVARALKQKGIVDVPNARSSHSLPTVRGAGLATGFVLTLTLAMGRDRATISLAVVALLATILGGVEDLRGTAVALRLVAQMIIGAAFLAVVLTVGVSVPWEAVGAAMLFIVGYTNAFNFMDGINGISAVSASVAGLAFAAMAALTHNPDLLLSGAVIFASAVCFLPFNFPRARVFLGDSGSYSFGAVIACTAVTGWHAGIRADAILAPFAVYVADSGTVVLWRLVRGEPIAAPHRKHAYQRLVRLGTSHAQATGVVFVSSAATAALGLAVVSAGAAARVALDLGIVAVAALYLMLPTLLTARWRARTSEMP
jgi:UDP-N-acetylmuramyl pentapeptide phosphotransferase/UDP-N-acetylglucosamine-1-phosphate transferase